MVSKVLGNLEEIVLFCTMSGLIIVVTIQILSRLIGNPPSWTEEVSRQLLTWTVFMGAAAGVKLEEHVGTTYLVDRLSPRGRGVVRMVANLLFLSFALLMTYHGGQWVATLRDSGQRSTSFQTPVYLIAASVPVAFALSSVYLLRILYRNLRELAGEVSDEESRQIDLERDGV